MTKQPSLSHPIGSYKFIAKITKIKCELTMIDNNLLQKFGLFGAAAVGFGLGVRNHNGLLHKSFLCAYGLFAIADEAFYGSRESLCIFLAYFVSYNIGRVVKNDPNFHRGLRVGLNTI